MTQGGVAGSKVVDADVDTLLAQSLQRPCRRVGVVQKSRLGYLEPERFWGNLGRLDDPRDHIWERGLDELAWGEVDAEREVASGRLGSPPGELPASLLEDPCSDRDNQGRLLGVPDELDRWDQPTLGVLPAQQGFEARDLPSGDAHNRLIVDLELVALEATTQRGVRM